MAPEFNEKYTGVRILWIILNVCLVIYALALFLYAKLCRQRDSFQFKTSVNGDKSLFENQSLVKDEEEIRTVDQDDKATGLLEG